MNKHVIFNTRTHALNLPKRPISLAVIGSLLALSSFSYANITIGSTSGNTINSSGATTSQTNTIAIGSGSQANANDTIAIGSNAGKGSSTQATAANLAQNIFIGKQAGENSKGYWNTLVGDNNTGAQLKGNANLGLGGQALGKTIGNRNIGLGEKAGNSSNGDHNIAIGADSGSQVAGQQNLAIGTNAGKTVKGKGNTAIGYFAGSHTQGSFNIAYGYESGQNIIGSNNISIGHRTNLNQKTNHSIAIGVNAKASNNDDIVLGSNSSTPALQTTPQPITNVTINGINYQNFQNGSQQNVEGSVSIGISNNQDSSIKVRRLLNLAAGRLSATSTDATNGSQLYAIAHTLGNLAQSSAQLLGKNTHIHSNGTLSISNIGDTGKNTLHEAIATINAQQQNQNQKLKQLHSQITTLNTEMQIHHNQTNELKQNIHHLHQRINTLEQDQRAGIANAMAIAGLPQANQAGQNALAIAASTYQGANGYAIGVSHTTYNGKWVIKAAASGNSRGHHGATVGTAFLW